MFDDLVAAFCTLLVLAAVAVLRMVTMPHTPTTIKK